MKTTIKQILVGNFKMPVMVAIVGCSVVLFGFKTKNENSKLSFEMCKFQFDQQNQEITINLLN